MALNHQIQCVRDPHITAAALDTELDQIWGFERVLRGLKNRDH